MEPGFVPNPFCAVRPKGVRHQLPRTGLEATLWIFGTVPGGNGSASAVRLMLAKFHLDLHLPSALNVVDIYFSADL